MVSKSCQFKPFEQLDQSILLSSYSLFLAFMDIFRIHRDQHRENIKQILIPFFLRRNHLKIIMLLRREDPLFMCVCVRVVCVCVCVREREREERERERECVCVCVVIDITMHFQTIWLQSKFLLSLLEKVNPFGFCELVNLASSRGGGRSNLSFFRKFSF